MSTTRRRNLYLLIAALLFIGSRGVAQSSTGNAADQNFKSIPQTVKANAENKASNKANAVGDSATRKIDSGMNKAYRAIVGVFKKKKKRDTVAVTTPPAVTPATPPPPGGVSMAGEGRVDPAWARRNRNFLKIA